MKVDYFDYQAFGRELNKRCKEVSTRKIAQLTGVNKDQISKAKNGRRTGAQTIFALSYFYDISLDDLRLKISKKSVKTN